MTYKDTNYPAAPSYRLCVFFRIPGSLKKPVLSWGGSATTVALSATHDNPRERRQNRRLSRRATPQPPAPTVP